MRQKGIDKVIILCMCLVMGSMLSSVVSYAQEASEQAVFRATYIQSGNADLSISDSGVAACTGSVNGISGVSSTYVKITLQKYVSGSWQDVKSWEASSSSRSTSITETYPVSRGTYRVVATCQANTETKEATSITQTY